MLALVKNQKGEGFFERCVGPIARLAAQMAKIAGAGKVRLTPMIGVRGLAEWEEAFCDLGAGRAMKLLLKPQDD